MLFSIVLPLLVTSCVEATALFECDNVPTDDPCGCDKLIFILVNDTTTPGTSFASFNNSPQSSSCSEFNITDGHFILLVDLRKPCASGESCGIMCGEISKPVEFVALKMDVLPPVFPNATFTTETLESEEVGTIVFDFNKPEYKPTDDDCSESLSFNFFVGEAGGGNETFGFRPPSSGKLIIVKNVDYEMLEEYSLTVGVRSSVQGVPGLLGYTNVIVKIQDVDDNNPEFKHLVYSLNITEETISTTPLSGSPPVRGYDKDKGINQTILYSFSDYKNSSDFLEINTVEGTFSVTKAIDRENNGSSSYEMILWCYQSDNHEKRASATLYINVLDINDNPAVFAPDVYYVTLVENAVGHVTTVTATDKDSPGDNSVIIYEMINVTETFTVNNISGEVRVKSAAGLDREKTPVLKLLVRAKDKEGNLSANTATVIITLQDVNDNSPEFQEDVFAFHINSSNNGDPVGQVNATDSDEAGSPNANVTYELYTAVTKVPFIIDEYNGSLTIQGQFDQHTDYNFLVRACDNPVQVDDRRCSIVSVVVLYGKNVTFVTAEASMEVRENVQIGTIFGVVLPVSGDKYVCSTEDFDVDMQSGMLMTKIHLDREKNDTHNFYVEVFKFYLPKGNISLHISILDMNDNAPTFTQEEYMFNINGHIDKNTLLGTLTAMDEDEEENANLTFRFHDSSSELFTIDDVTGDVKTSDQWKDSTVQKQTLYYLIAEVTDHGKPHLLSVAPVYVSSVKINADSAVGIPTALSKLIVMEDDNKRMIEGQLKELLGFDTVHITGFDESSSYMFIKAYMNNTEVKVTDLQRSLIQYWSPLQELLRQYMEPRTAMEHSDTDLSTSEIALITISVAILLGGLISMIVICRQWNTHVKNRSLYDTLRRPSNMYDSQELHMDFAEEESPRSRFSTFRGPGRKENENLEGSFGLGFVNTAYSSEGEGINAPTTPTWSCSDVPRVPRWSTSDSLKDAMESLEELTNRLNSEDNISRVSNISRGRKSQKSNKSEPVTPRSESNQPPNNSTAGVSKGYEEFILTPSSDYQKLNIAPRYENLVISQPSEKTEVEDMHNNKDNEDGYDSGISEAERMQELIETNKDTQDFENAEVASSEILGDVVQEELTAF